MSTNGTVEKHHDDGSLGENSDAAAAVMDLSMYHETNAGRLVVDPEEARAEFGEKTAAGLKLSRDGTKVLWPQPTDNPEDPLNWSDARKTKNLVIWTLAAIVPDFQSATGIAALFPLAAQFKTSTGEINNLTSNWSIFLLGFGGIFGVMLMRRFGRLPVLFWSQLISTGFIVGCTFAPNLATFAGMRCLNAFFGTIPQVTGLYVITDMYPFHVQARMINFWTMGFVSSPFISPFLFGFLVARANWRWAYGIASIYNLIVVILVALFVDETIYDRAIRPIPTVPAGTTRFKTLIGITGAKMAQYRPSWRTVALALPNIMWRPHLLGVMLYEALLFGFGIGINVTNVVFLGSPPPVGFGFSQFAIAGMYATPLVAVVIGELFGRWANDKIMNLVIRRNHGVFYAEGRLWACYLAITLYVIGFVVLGAAFQKHLSVGAIVMGWGLAEVAIMLNTVVVYAYANNCFPRHQGEISAYVNFARTLGGFAVAFFQVPWASKNGALQTFGCEAAIVAGLFLLSVPIIQLKGQSLRKRFGNV